MKNTMKKNGNCKNKLIRSVEAMIDDLIIQSKDQSTINREIYKKMKDYDIDDIRNFSTPDFITEFTSSIEDSISRINEMNGLEYDKWCITTDGIIHGEIVYLGWERPLWIDDDGYFWTSKEIIEKIVNNNTPEHPFIFNSRKEAIKHLKTLHIPQKCRIIKFV